MTRKFGELVMFSLLAMVLVVVPVASSMADTSAASYHWARKRSQFTLKVGHNLSGDWNTYLRRTLADWNKNDTVTLDKVRGRTNPQECRPTTGMVEVCNWPYGTQTGWLGLTRLHFDRSGHIEAVTVQLNDSFLYARHGFYNSDASRLHTICHEVGHATGIEGHDNNRSCMNDSEEAIFNNVRPIHHDFRELKRTYDHKDGETTVSSASVTSEGLDTPTSLPSVRNEDATSETVTVQNLDDGRTVVTYITWAKH